MRLSDEEIDKVLPDIWHKHTLRELGVLVHRTTRRVKESAARLGLPPKRPTVIDHAEAFARIKPLASSLSTGDVAKQLGMSRSFVYKICEEFGIKCVKAPSKYSDAEVARGAAMAKVLGVEAAARELGINHRVVRRWCRRAGVTPLKMKDAAARIPLPKGTKRRTRLLGGWRTVMQPYYREQPDMAR